MSGRAEGSNFKQSLQRSRHNPFNPLVSCHRNGKDSMRLVIPLLAASRSML
eukprot:CAMPEP_0176265332 /NCGR_PEP_ID=MMETSP0121_2-20121125/42089_1 /TAXON_ID=160619 /ORGANISM="Kryptoperidinium foliaceum, Strain CCMP 1326" /LENGTH=50 /DNA_ID=CAMNT_0017605361 /DNA_START=47 /DNA_END=196 /DNA_ORIENTATION=-